MSIHDLHYTVLVNNAQYTLRRLSFDPEKTWLIVQLSGSLGNHNSGTLESEINALIAPEPGLTELHIDLGLLNYVSSTGLGALIRTSMALRRSGIRLVLIDTPAHIRSIIDLLGFSNSLSFRQSEATS